MSDYNPALLALKWQGRLPALLAETRALWSAGRPRKRFFSWGESEPDAPQDRATPREDRQALIYEGEVVMGHFARAFFPAYIPGRNTHHGSVVYSLRPDACDEVFRLAWAVNELRRDGGPPPAGTEDVAEAIRDDQSSFASLRLPDALGQGRDCYFGNICIQRTRLPSGYLHSRVAPVLCAPGHTRWCCLLPLRFWSPALQELWRSGPPACQPEPFEAQCRAFGIEP